MSDDYSLLGLLGTLALGVLAVLVLMWSSARTDSLIAGNAAQAMEWVQEAKAENPDWPWGSIDAGTIELGMSDVMVRAAIGWPDDFVDSEDAGGSHWQWVYDKNYGDDSKAFIQRNMGIDHRVSHRYDYVYFENGVVTGWTR
jgi:hypothetical protein